LWVAQLCLLGLQAAAWGLAFALGMHYPALLSFGAIAYGLGLRHAVDADHIAAIDNTTRKLVHEGKQPLGIGLYFSLGHSTIVFLLTLTLAEAVHAFAGRLSGLEAWGYLGTIISAGFLYLIAALNVGVLVDVWRAWHQLRFRRAALSAFAKDDVEAVIAQSAAWSERRGLLSRLYRRLFRLVSHSWQMYFVGLLFGLGFETASEVALLGVSSTATAHVMPVLDVLVLPLLFSAGMGLIDAADGIFMLYAYRWAFNHPVRRITYNLVITAVSVLVALGVGTIEWLQVADSQGLLGNFLGSWVDHLDFGAVGYGVIAVLALTWLAAWVVMRPMGQARQEAE
jgi:high-affinity nickel-transport protein